MDRALFSIIIAAHNRASLLPSTLDSVLAQTLTNAEVIVVDDGSTDDTPALIDAYAARFPEKFRVIHQQNAGPGAARNRGMVEATGRYICFLDSDDLWLPWTLATCAAAIETHGEPAMLVASVVEFDKALPAVEQLPLRTESFADFYSAADVAMWHGCSAVVMKADVVKQAGGFVQQHINAEDTDLWMKAGRASGFVRVLDPVTVGYRRHETSAVGNVAKTVAGMFQLIDAEKTGRYPGGADRWSQRIAMITRHTRPASLEAARAGLFADAWRLYRSTFTWNLSLGRWKYLLAFPLNNALPRRSKGLR